MQNSPIEFYKEKVAEYSEKINSHKRIQRAIVLLRLAVFILAVFLPLAFISSSVLISFLVFVPLITIFLYLVKKFTIIEKKIKYYSLLVDINLHEQEALRGNFTNFKDGAGFSDHDHPYSFDLDLFGPDSLFQSLNRCATWPGMEYLAGMLLETAGEENIITRRQKAFTELSEHPGFCQHFLASGKMHDDDPGDRAKLLEYVNSPSYFTSRHGLFFASRFLPLITTGSLVLAIAGVFPFPLFIFMFIVQLGITIFFLGRINTIHQKVTRQLGSLRKYKELLHIIQHANFTSPLLKSVQRYLRTNGLAPSDYIVKLAGIVDAFDNRLNIIAGILLNGMLLWDINCVLRLEKWNRRHRKHLPLWLESISRMDAYISFSVYTFNNPGFVFPRVLKNGPVIDAAALGHPLITEVERVSNDFLIDEQGKFIIITGANMAGKSTFLRTTGVALVLAMAGAPVCAGEFRFRIMEVYTSMRTSDSLSRNESYFYAELKRLKHLIERIAAGKKVFVILDEILKGTNSVDKERGSVALIENMISMGSTGIIATHDLSLTSMEERFSGRVENKCFEIEIEGDSIKFDYLLRAGVTRKMNALVLMKQMGLLMGDQLKLDTD